MTWLDNVSIKDTKLLFQRFLDRCLFSIQFYFICLISLSWSLCHWRHNISCLFCRACSHLKHFVQDGTFDLGWTRYTVHVMCFNICWEYFVLIRKLFSVNYYVIYYQQMYQQFSPLHQLRIYNGRLIYFSKAMALSSIWSNITSVTDLQQIASLLNYYFK